MTKFVIRSTEPGRVIKMVKKLQINVSDELFAKVNEFRKDQFMSAEEYCVVALRRQVLASARMPVAPKKKLVLEDLYSRPAVSGKDAVKKGVAR